MTARRDLVKQGRSDAAPNKGKCRRRQKISRKCCRGALRRAVLESARWRGGAAMQTLSVKTDRRTQLVDVTAQVQKAVASSGVASGICYLYVPHTTAAITINECPDPGGARDVRGALGPHVPLVGASAHTHR